MFLKITKLMSLFSVKISLAMITVVSLTYITSGFIEYKSQENYEIENMALESQSLETRLNNTAAFMLWNLDHDVLEKFLISEVSFSRVAYIGIEANFDTVITAGNKLLEGFTEHKATLFYQDTKMGEVYIQLDKKPMEERLDELLVKTILEAVVEVILLAAVCVFLTRYYVTIPLSNLEISMTAIEKGTDLAKIQVKGNYDEVSRVSILFNKIIAKIQALLEEATQKNEELNKVLNKLTTMQDQLVESEKMASLGSLVAGVAHEINTPVGIGITASTSAIETINELKGEFNARTLKGASFNKHVAMLEQCNNLIYSNLERVGNLISSFKQLAVDQAIEDRRSINLYAYVHELLLSIKPAFKTKKINFCNNVPQDISFVTQPGLLAQIFTNLLMNAGIHAFDKDQEGAVEITAELLSAERIKIRIIDDGKGMDAALIASVFDPFVTTKRNSGGTGLGANISYNLVTQKLEGTIICLSMIGKGTTFEIELPLKA